jgi:hypothetical protein
MTIRTPIVNIGGGLSELPSGDVTPPSLFEYAHASYTVSDGTDGGSFQSGDWRTRPLNTVSSNIGATLSSNQITLPAGTYSIDGRAAANIIGNNRLRLRNITNSTTLVHGFSQYDNSTSGIHMAVIRGVFTLGASATLELQHYGTLTRNSTGMGAPVSAGSGYEVYADVFFMRVRT